MTDMSNLPTAEPNTSPMQNSKKMTTPTQKPSHTSAKRAEENNRAADQVQVLVRRIRKRTSVYFHLTN
ncbi:hypothetical protein PF007_g21142 [Phytophthora fragariae]|uniref:Uncharacterized protein n=1 Tax=Phytophthora fragariae TaxID=53985 RepID=A0A6A3QYG6_9STRA|nr:hypothetical protein PF007_g21142 [Phytophthora fragariae]